MCFIMKKLIKKWNGRFLLSIENDFLWNYYDLLEKLADLVWYNGYTEEELDQLIFYAQDDIEESSGIAVNGIWTVLREKGYNYDDLNM